MRSHLMLLALRVALWLAPREHADILPCLEMTIADIAVWLGKDIG